MIDDKIEEFLNNWFKVFKKKNYPIGRDNLAKGMEKFLTTAEDVPEKYAEKLSIFLCIMAENSGINSLLCQEGPDKLQILNGRFTDPNIKNLSKLSMAELKDPTSPDFYGLYRHLQDYILTR